MRNCLALLLLVALGSSCEPFPEQNDPQFDDAREAFERWKKAMIGGRYTEVVELMTVSFRSQWVYDRLREGDRAALEWKSKLVGGARSDLDLWFGEAGKEYSTRGRASTLPRTVLIDPSLISLLVGYLKDARSDVIRDFLSQKVKKVSSDALGVSILTRNVNNEPEFYQLINEDGFWKVDGYRKGAGQ